MLEGSVQTPPATPPDMGTHRWNCMLKKKKKSCFPSPPHPHPQVSHVWDSPPVLRACSNTDQLQQLLIKILRFVLIHKVNWSWWLASLISWVMPGKQIFHSSWDCLCQLGSAHLDECKRPLSLSPGYFGALFAPMCYALPPASIPLLARCLYSPVPPTPPTTPRQKVCVPAVAKTNPKESHWAGHPLLIFAVVAIRWPPQT